MHTSLRHKGYTLIELMITLGIIGVLSTIAIPAYEGYISSSKSGVAKTNARSLAGFEDTYFYENDTYYAGTYDPGGDVTSLPSNISWRPEGDKDDYIYKVEACGTGTIAQCYKITVTSISDSSISEVIERKP